MHVPGLAEKALAVGAECGGDDEGGAVVLDLLGGATAAAVGVDQVDEIGEAVGDDQLGQTQAGSFGDTGQLVEQLGRVGAVFIDTGLGQREHRSAVHGMAGPHRAAGQGDAFVGVAADVVAESGAMGAAHLAVRTAQLKYARHAH